MKKNYIPTINIDSLLRNNFDTKKAKSTLEKIKKASVEVGFFQITKHGISKKDINDIAKVGNNFFKSSDSNKMKLAPKKWNKLSDEKTGEQYFDLTAPSFKYRRELGVKALHYVQQDQVGRVDKISELYFGTGAYVDAICIVNNIFNPFIIQEGDIFYEKISVPKVLKNHELYRTIVNSY